MNGVVVNCTSSFLDKCPHTHSFSIFLLNNFCVCNLLSLFFIMRGLCSVQLPLYLLLLTNHFVKQVKDELYNQRKTVVKITGDSLCSLCNKKIGTSVFAVYPNGKTLVHFVCFRDSQSMKAVAKGSPLRRRWYSVIIVDERNLYSKLSNDDFFVKFCKYSCRRNVKICASALKCKTTT